MDAVAQEAGISKASVLYDYGTKQGLIKAVIERRIEMDDRALADIVAASDRAADADIKAYVARASCSPTEEDRAVTTSLCATLREDEIRQPVRDVVRRRRSAILTSATVPRGAMLAFLAIEGLLCLERFDLQPWTDEERAGLIADIEWLATHGPDDSRAVS
ncbi:TetR/AcrR family transcriptional regulator [Marinivivus vitaminiproducens]|uniref:TetR/AcrR family transcriptional regulator n=1 Tax=Marinivivus vitaminiproducens TaxID=3035935 RepID=UPI003F9ED744